MSRRLIKVFLYAFGSSVIVGSAFWIAVAVLGSRGPWSELLSSVVAVPGIIWMGPLFLLKHLVYPLLRDYWFESAGDGFFLIGLNSLLWGATAAVVAFVQSVIHRPENSPGPSIDDLEPGSPAKSDKRPSPNAPVPVSFLSGLRPMTRILVLGRAAALVAVAVALAWLAMRFLRNLPVPADLPLPPALGALRNQKVGPYVTRAADLPESVKAAAKEAFRSRQFSMADVGGRWEPTDMVTDASLPDRRLIWGARVGDHYVVHYEMGGLGLSVHLLVFGPERQGRRQCVWLGACDGSFWSVASFARGVVAGKTDSRPAILH